MLPAPSRMTMQILDATVAFLSENSDRNGFKQACLVSPVRSVRLVPFAKQGPMRRAWRVGGGDRRLLMASRIKDCELDKISQKEIDRFMMTIPKYGIYIYISQICRFICRLQYIIYIYIDIFLEVFRSSYILISSSYTLIPDHHISQIFPSFSDSDSFIHIYIDLEFIFIFSDPDSLTIYIYIS